MKYYEVKFSVRPATEDAFDLVAAFAGEAGFETFDTSGGVLTGYVQQQLFDREQLDTLLSAFPMPGVTVDYTVAEAEDRDWNAQWEQEGFEPIVVGGDMVIHDGRHTGSADLSAYKVAIEIDARLAFGTGTHETTRMVCSALQEVMAAARDDAGTMRVLDCGCGTGILGIAAMKLGAGACVAYDIDEWSVENTRHNAVINHVDITPLHGDATVLGQVDGRFDVVMANINRNILLADMPAFRSKMARGAWLILSGFYTTDVPLLTAKAATLGLTVSKEKEEGGWACLVLRYS